MLGKGKNKSKELTEHLQNARFYLTSKTLWVWIVCTVAIAGWAVTGIMWYKDSQSTKQFKTDTKNEQAEMWKTIHKQNENLAGISSGLNNLTQLVSSGVKQQNELVTWRLNNLERYHNVPTMAIPPRDSITTTLPRLGN